MDDYVFVFSLSCSANMMCDDIITMSQYIFTVSNGDFPTTHLCVCVSTDFLTLDALSYLKLFIIK